MDTLGVILLAIGLETAALVLLLSLTLLTQIRKSGGKARRRADIWAVLLAKALAGDREAIESLGASLDSDQAWRAFHVLIDERLRGEPTRPSLNLRRVSREVGLTQRLYHDLLHARDPLVRAAAGKTLARLRERVAEDKVLELLRSKDPAVVLAAAYAATSYRNTKWFLPVLRAVYDRTPITLHGAAELLSAFGEDVCPVIHGLLEDMLYHPGQAAAAAATDQRDRDKAIGLDDTAAQVIMADLLAFFAYRPAAPTLLRLLTISPNDEVVIHVVKALAELDDGGATIRLRELLTHPNWIIRSQSVRALAALNATEALPQILGLLADDNLMVRTSAQKAARSLEVMEETKRDRMTEVSA